MAATIPLVGVWALTGSATAQGTGLPEFVPLVEANGPAVVNISTRQTNGPARRGHGFTIPDLPEGNPLNEFFRRYFGEEGRRRWRRW